VMDPRSPRYADIGPEAAASIIAGGSGLLGTNLEYFENLAMHVDALGIKDDVFERMRASLHRAR
jgi:cation transport regulator ChaC